MNRKLTDDVILQMAALLPDLPVHIKVERAAQLWGYKSKNSAWHILKRLQELGIVRHEITSDNVKGEWFLE